MEAAVVTLPHSREMEREADLIGASRWARARPGRRDARVRGVDWREEEDRRRSAGDEEGGPPRRKRGGSRGRGGGDGTPEVLLDAPAHGGPPGGRGGVRVGARAGRGTVRGSDARVTRAPAKASDLFFSSAAASSAARGLPPNAFASANRATVSAPTRAWRRRFAREEMRAVADSPRGVQTAAVTLGPRTLGAEHEGVRSGPIGRFDERRAREPRVGRRSRAVSRAVGGLGVGCFGLVGGFVSEPRVERAGATRGEAEAAAAAGPGTRAGTRRRAGSNEGARGARRGGGGGGTRRGRGIEGRSARS